MGKASAKKHEIFMGIIGVLGEFVYKFERKVLENFNANPLKKIGRKINFSNFDTLPVQSPVQSSLPFKNSTHKIVLKIFNF